MRRASTTSSPERSGERTLLPFVFRKLEVGAIPASGECWICPFDERFPQGDIAKLVLQNKWYMRRVLQQGSGRDDRGVLRQGSGPIERIVVDAGDVQPTFATMLAASLVATLLEGQQ